METITDACNRLDIETPIACDYERVITITDTDTCCHILVTTDDVKKIMDELSADGIERAQGWSDIGYVPEYAPQEQIPIRFVAGHKMWNGKVIATGIPTQPLNRKYGNERYGDEKNGVV